MENILWNKLEVVILDVDGTFYEQSKLRWIMFFKLVLYYTLRPWRYNELFILYYFRKEREKRAGFKGTNLKEEQYRWCAEKVNVNVEVVRRVIRQWIFNKPNIYLKECMYPGISQFLDVLKKKNIKTAVYSDYDPRDKLEHMGIQVDLGISSTDESVNSFKPCPDGLYVILSEMKITNKNNCLYIGDRHELDGLCAERAEIPFLFVDKKMAVKDFYLKLSAELINAKN